MEILRGGRQSQQSIHEILKLYLKEFSLYPRVNCENNEVTFEADYIFTSDYNQANKFKISDASYIGSLLREGTSLKYIY